MNGISGKIKQMNLQEYLKSFKKPLDGKIKFLKDGEEIIPNLFIKYEFGSTPGSINLILNSEGKRIWFTGDMVHSDLQFEHENWSYYTDNNEERAIKTKKDALNGFNKTKYYNS